MTRIDEDLHVHSRWSDGRGTLEENLEVAERLGLRRLGCVDHVREDTAWVPDFVKAVRALQRTTPVELLVGVEAKLLDVAGHVDVPLQLRGVDRIYVADHKMPIGDTCVPPSVIRRAILDGSLRREAVLDGLMQSTARAIQHPVPCVIAHLFSILPKCGLSVDDVDDDAIRRLAVVARQTGTWMEIDERWSCPGRRVARIFASEDVPVVFSTDSHRPETIGQYVHGLDVWRELHPPLAA